MDFLPNFENTFILAKSSLGLLDIIFMQIWSLIYFRILFPLNILSLN